MKILVTGAAGYVGGTIVGERGGETLALDMRECQFPNRWNCETVRCELQAQVKLVRVLEDFKPDVVIHAAALTYPAESIREPLRYWQTNVDGTGRLLQAMTLAGTRNIVFLSSSSVYGVSPEHAHGNHGLFPVSPYGQTKLAGEQMIKAWVEAGEKASEPVRRGARILRLTNVAGAADSWGENQGESLRILPAMLRRIDGDQRPLRIYGEGRGQMRQFVHPLDVASASLMAASQLARGGCDTVTCNVVGGGCMSDMHGLADLVGDVTGRRVDFETHPARAGDPAIVQMLPDAKQALSGWEPKYGLRDIIHTAWLWHQKHPEWRFR